MAIDITKFKTRRVLVVGDLVIDEFIQGTVESLTREAPVPVVTVDREYIELGGAGNVARNLAALGARTSVVGVMGSGAGSRIMTDAFARHKIDSTGVYSEKNRKTHRKTRIISSCQQMLQLERETKTPVSIPAESAMILTIRERIPDVDLVIVSDHGKGTLTRSLLTELFSLARKRNIMVVVDPWGTGYEKYNGASILIPDVRELALETGIPTKERPGLFKAGAELLKTTRADGLAVTCGRDGIVIFEKAVQPVFIESEPRQVFDATGVHDTMVAVLGLALATGGSFKDSATVANVAAGIVMDKIGTARVTEKEMILELMAYSGKSAPASSGEVFARKQTFY